MAEFLPRTVYVVVVCGGVCLGGSGARWRQREDNTSFNCSVVSDVKMTRTMAHSPNSIKYCFAIESK